MIGMRGFTLIELAVVVALTAFAAASLAPAARRYRDRAAVLAAREAMVGVLAEARVTALASGEAHVSIESGPWVARSEQADSVLSVVRLESEWGVTVGLPGRRSSSRISFNALGLGRMASQTLVFRRGGASASLVVSSLGRVRRR